MMLNICVCIVLYSLYTYWTDGRFRLIKAILNDDMSVACVADFCRSSKLPAKNKVLKLNPKLAVRTLFGLPEGLLTSRFLPLYCGLIPIKRSYKKKILVVSYGWKSVANPDPIGDTFRAIKDFLENSEEEYIGVIIDYSSFYQLPRSEEQDNQFEKVLGDMHLLYTFPNVTVLRVDADVTRQDDEIDRLRKHVYIFNTALSLIEIEDLIRETGIGVIAVAEKIKGLVFVARCYKQHSAQSLVDNMRHLIGDKGSVVLGYCDVQLNQRTWPTVEYFAAIASGNTIYYSNCRDPVLRENVVINKKCVDETFLRITHSRSCVETRRLAMKKFINTLVVFGFWRNAIWYYGKSWLL